MTAIKESKVSGWLNLAKNYAKAGDYSVSIITLLQVISFENKSHHNSDKLSKAFNLLGYDRYYLNSFNCARHDFSRAIKVSPIGKYYRNRGLTLIKLNNYKDALKDLNTAIRLHDDKSTVEKAYYNEISLYSKLGEYRKANKLEEAVDRLKYSVKPSANLRSIQKFNDLVGLNGVKKVIRQIISTSLINKQLKKRGISRSGQPVLNLVFTGNPGTGKTTAARLIGDIFYQKGILSKDTFNEVNAKDLVSPFEGKTAIKTHNMIKSSLGGILFIDEAYDLIPRPGTFNQEAVDQIVSDITRYQGKLIIIMAGYKKPMKRLFKVGNPGLISRFSYWIPFKDYNWKEMTEIMDLKLRKNHIIVSPQKNRKFNRNARYQLVSGIRYLMDLAKRKGIMSSLGNGRFIDKLIEILNNVHDKRIIRRYKNLNQVSTRALITVNINDVNLAVNELANEIAEFE